jgi:hypothetical protein
LKRAAPQSRLVPAEFGAVGGAATGVAGTATVTAAAAVKGIGAATAAASTASRGAARASACEAGQAWLAVATETVMLAAGFGLSVRAGPLAMSGSHRRLMGQLRLLGDIFMQECQRHSCVGSAASMHIAQSPIPSRQLEPRRMRQRFLRPRGRWQESPDSDCNTEPIFENVFVAQESIPPVWKSIPRLLKGTQD